MSCYYVSKQQYQTYIGTALKHMDSKLRNLPNMRPAEKWIAPFDEDDGSVHFQWPHYNEIKGKMVEVSPILKPKPRGALKSSLGKLWNRAPLFVLRLPSAPNFAHRSLKFTPFVGSTTAVGTYSQLRLESSEPLSATSKTKTCRSSIGPLHPVPLKIVLPTTMLTCGSDCSFSTVQFL